MSTRDERSGPTANQADAERASAPGRPAAPPSERSALAALSRALETAGQHGSAATTGLFVMALFGVLWLARVILIPLAFALMLYFVFRPLVRALRRMAIPTVLAALLVIGGITGALGYGVFRLAEPAAEWVQRLPSALRGVERKVMRLRQPVEQVNKLVDKVEQMTQVDKTKASREVVVDRPGLGEAIVEQARDVGAGAVVALFGFFFMLVWGDQLLGRLVGLVPDLRGADRSAAVMTTVERRMSRYLGTITLVNIALGAAVGTVLWLLGMPNPLLWGVVATVLHFIPYLGGLVGVCLVGLASLVTFPDLTHALLPPAAYFVLGAIEGNFVSPMLLGKTFRLSPLVIFVWLLFWGWLWGLAGAVLAVPLLMLVKVAADKSPSLAPLGALLEG